MFGMFIQRVPHLKFTRVVNHHFGALSARRKSAAIMREFEEPNFFAVDIELKHISQWELTSVTHMIRKKRWRS